VPRILKMHLEPAGAKCTSAQNWLRQKGYRVIGTPP
jgi:hypothetical protein